jgi:hypothetical protein
MNDHAKMLRALTLLLLILPAAGMAQLAQSTFATGTDGWLSVTMPYPSAIPPTILSVYTPTWVAASGGYLSMVDPDGTGAGNTEYWQAPAAFLGAKGAAYGGTLAFDIGNAGTGYPPFAEEDLILVGGGLTLAATLPSMPTASLGHYAITLTEVGWKRDALTGPDATRAEFQAVLADLDQLFIRAEYQLGPDTEYLDNVLMASGTSAAGPAAGAGFALGRCAPNPFNPSTVITLDVAQAERIRVDIVDAAGRAVRHLRDESLESGLHRLVWDGTDDDGLRAASGVYFCRASAGDLVLVRSMVLLK